jgi:myo-inositol-1(or 4)-monophosphatase
MPSDMPADRSTDVEGLLELAVRACRAAGEETRAFARRGGWVVGTKSSPRDLVTDADRASERALLEVITSARPDDAVQSEEGAARDGSTGLTWVMDPLDGTTNFVYGRARWAVSAACLDADGELVACTYDVGADETFTAARGRGASLDGAPIRAGDAERLDRALVGTGFSPDLEIRLRQAMLVARLVPLVLDLRRAGSPCLDLADVACGRLDGFFEVLPGRWDRAAGTLLVREAGGAAVTTGPERAPQLVAAGPRLFELLLRALED